MRREAVLSLGANLGEREENLKSALHAIEALPHTQLVGVSACYETEPFGVDGEQPMYLNCCAALMTELSARALLGACLGIEAALGRERTGFRAARVIDIDLLAVENEGSNDSELTLPHPRMLGRAFVLVPLLDLYPDGVLFGNSFREALNALDQSGVARYRGGIS